MISRSVACRSAVFAAALVLIAVPASAQRAMHPKTLEGQKPTQQPAALPGAEGGPAKADPRGPTSNLKPNEALFDAVNRGDLPAARQAVNRGADLEARNTLGLTALELSVDLARNPITFFLLSVRAGTETVGSPPDTAAPGGKAAPNKQAVAQAAPNKQAVAQAAPQPQPKAQPVAVTVATTHASAAPVQTAAPVRGNDPGTPAPQVGFLGFGNSR